MKFYGRFLPWKRQDSENEPNSPFKINGALRATSRMLPVCIDKKWPWEPFAFQIVNLAKPKSEPQRAVPRSWSQPVPAIVGSLHFWFPFLLLPSMVLPSSQCPLSSWHPPFSSLDHPCFSLLPFPFLIIQHPLLSSSYFFLAEECHFAIEMGSKDAFGCNLKRWRTHKVNSMYLMNLGTV